MRLGFLGVGWIGTDRLRAVAASGLAEVVVVADADAQTAARTAAEFGARSVSPGQLLADEDLDGVVIATPSALHAAQSVAAFERGLAVFCQKPLGRTAGECADVVAAARAADRLLGVDLSYRHLHATQAVREVLGSGRIGAVHAVDLVFHNAYGPDKAWFRDPVLSGGGCVLDLGTHLVDLALWLLDFPAVQQVSARLFAQGRPLAGRTDVVEDHAYASLDLDGGRLVNLTCSWDLPAGQDAVIGATFYGQGGAVALSNVGGSFYDFRADLLDGTRRTCLVEPPDDWGGRAVVAWTRQLAEGGRFDPACQELVRVARVLDRVYGR